MPRRAAHAARRRVAPVLSLTVIGLAIPVGLLRAATATGNPSCATPTATTSSSASSSVSCAAPAGSTSTPPTTAPASSASTEPTPSPTTSTASPTTSAPGPTSETSTPASSSVPASSSTPPSPTPSRPRAVPPPPGGTSGLALTAATLQTAGLRYDGTVGVNGRSALRFTLASATLTSLAFYGDCGQGFRSVTTAERGQAPGGLVMDLLTLSATVGGATVSYDVSSPPTQPLPSGAVELDDLSAAVVAIRGPGLTLTTSTTDLHSC